MTGIFDRLNGDHHDDEQRDVDGIERLHAGEDAQQEGNTLRTDKALREALQELLRVGLLEASARPNLYHIALVALERLNVLLEPMDLCARADEVRGLVFLAVRRDDEVHEQDDWSHPLVRKQRLNLEQTLLVAILRQHFVVSEQDMGIGSEQAVVAVDELIPHVQAFLGESGSEARDRTRVLQLLDQLKGHGLVSAPDGHDRVVIRPIIAHLANPENLTVLLHALKQQCAVEPGDDRDIDGAAEGMTDKGDDG